MEVNQRPEENVYSVHVLVPVPHDAKDREHVHQAGFLTSGYKRGSSGLPNPTKNGGCCPSAFEEMSCLPVTVARLRRISTDFPITPWPDGQGHLV